MPRFKSLIAIVGALAVFNTASATIINLSDSSSDDTPFELLTATMDFEVVGNTLTLTVTNTTADPNAYKINELFFNGPVVTDRLRCGFRATIVDNAERIHQA